MTTEEIIIAVYRVLGSLPVLFFPFPGAILAMLVDNFDVLLKGTLDEGGVSDYHAFDKWLDLVYMVTFLIVALRWQGAARNIAVGLFVYRLIGVVLFEVTNIRLFLFFFPALFENFFLFYAVLLRFFPDYDLTPRRLGYWLAILLVPKMVQEYVLHYRQWLDDVVAIEVIEDVAKPVLGWFGAVRIGLPVRWPGSGRF